MKRYKLYALALLAAACSLSCTDLLDVKPTTSLTKVAIYGDDASAESALIGCYAIIASYDYMAARYHEVVTLHSTEFTTTLTNATSPPLAKMDIASSHNEVNIIYNTSFKAINAINSVIESVQESAAVSETAKTRILGEAHFLRAFMYFNTVRFFGPVPMPVKSPTSLSEAHLPRESEANIYALIVNDLKTAWGKLPYASAQKKGYPNKYAAKSMLAKVYMTMAGDDQSSPYWQSCYNEAKEVYDSCQLYNIYKLSPSFSKLWDVSNQNNEESIFEVQLCVLTNGRLCSANLPKGCTLTPNIASNNNNFARTRLAPEMYDDFNAKYPGDPRIALTIIYGEYYENPAAAGGNPVRRTVYPTANAGHPFPYLRKYVDASVTGAQGNNNMVVLRYADLLLMLAESANELGRTEEARGYVNKVLDRARDANGNGTFEAGEIQPAQWATGMSQSDFRNAVMDERKFELMGEVQRWFDVRRRGEAKFKAVMERHNQHIYITSGKTGAGYFKWDVTDANVKKNMHWPIPSAEIIANDAIGPGDQNPGY